MRRWLIPAGLAALALTLGACGSEEPRANKAIFAAAPWSGPERMHYNLTERGELQGVCTLETEPDVALGVTELRRLCTDPNDGRYQDNGFARVDSETLRPLSSLRVIADLEEDERRFATTYLQEEHLVRFDSREYGIGETEPRATLSTERDLPAPTESLAEPGWYDDEELLWLVRGVPLEEGFDGAFTNVNAATGRVFDVEVTVEGREEVEVPAGTFEAWKIRIETSTVTQFAWVDVEAPHRVVRARIERLTYELTAVD